MPNAFTVHCVSHRLYLVAQNLSARLHNSLQYVIKAIRSKSMNDGFLSSFILKTMKNSIVCCFIQKFEGCQKVPV